MGRELVLSRTENSQESQGFCCLRLALQPQVADRAAGIQSGHWTGGVEVLRMVS